MYVWAWLMSIFFSITLKSYILPTRNINKIICNYITNNQYGKLGSYLGTSYSAKSSKMSLNSIFHPFIQLSMLWSTSLYWTLTNRKCPIDIITSIQFGKDDNHLIISSTCWDSSNHQSPNHGHKILHKSQHYNESL